MQLSEEKLSHLTQTMLLYLKHFRRNKYLSYTLTNSTIIKDTTVEHQSRQEALSRFECVNTSFMRYIKPSGVLKKKSVGYSWFVNKKSKTIFQKLWSKGWLRAKGWRHHGSLMCIHTIKGVSTGKSGAQILNHTSWGLHVTAS